MEKQPRAAIGQKFKIRGKIKDTNCIVEDIYITRNAAGEFIKLEYFCSHEFCGQKIYHTECETTVLRNAI